MISLKLNVCKKKENGFLKCFYHHIANVLVYAMKKNSVSFHACICILGQRPGSDRETYDIDKCIRGPTLYVVKAN